MAKNRVHNEYFRTVSLGGRKSCPRCHAKLEGEKIWSWGEYVSAKWRTVTHFCGKCFAKNVRPLLVDHAKNCGCQFDLIGYQGERLPVWLTLDPVEQIRAEAEEIARLQQLVKYQSMIYDCEEKERAAAFNGLPLQTYYMMPYKEWAKIKEEYHSNLSKAEVA